jgi:hypothetical protein
MKLADIIFQSLDRRPAAADGPSIDEVILRDLRHRRKVFDLNGEAAFVFPSTTTPELLGHLLGAGGVDSETVQVRIGALVRHATWAELLELLNTTEDVTLGPLRGMPPRVPRPYKPLRIPGYDPRMDAALVRLVPEIRHPRLGPALAQHVLHHFVKVFGLSQDALQAVSIPTRTTLLDMLRVVMDVSVEDLVVTHIRRRRTDLRLTWHGKHVKTVFAFGGPHASPDALEHVIRQALPVPQEPRRLVASIRGKPGMSLDLLGYHLEAGQCLDVEIVDTRAPSESELPPPPPSRYADLAGRLAEHDTLLHRLVPGFADLDRPTQTLLWTLTVISLVHGPLSEMDFFVDHALGLAPRATSSAAPTLMDILKASAAVRRLSPNAAGNALVQSLREHRKEFTLVRGGRSKTVFVFPRTTTPSVLEYLCREAHGVKGPAPVQLSVGKRDLSPAEVIEALNTTEPVTVDMAEGPCPVCDPHPSYVPPRLPGYDPSTDETLQMFVPAFQRVASADPPLAAALAAVIVHTVGVVMTGLSRQRSQVAGLLAPVLSALDMYAS